ncbi:hypothetical protein N185_32870 [Sinorhizobium sp. GW3]|nr:hypothetical protein N185_32870 [Sinorhizobium sp. GW3]
MPNDSNCSKPIVSGRTGAIRFWEEVHAYGAEFFRVACEHGHEGIKPSRGTRPIDRGAGRTQKIKCVPRDTFVIVGYGGATVTGAIGRLLLAAKKGAELVLAGGYGAGWNKESVQLRELLDIMPAIRPPVVLKRRGAISANL